MLGQRSGRIILGNPEAGNVTVIRLLQQPKGGAGYCDSLDILLQWNSAPFTAGDAIPLSIQIKGAGLVIRAFLSRFEIPRPRPSSIFRFVLFQDCHFGLCQQLNDLLTGQIQADLSNPVVRQTLHYQRQIANQKMSSDSFWRPHINRSRIQICFHDTEAFFDVPQSSSKKGSTVASSFAMYSIRLAMA